MSDWQRKTLLEGAMESVGDDQEQSSETRDLLAVHIANGAHLVMQNAAAAGRSISFLEAVEVARRTWLLARASLDSSLPMSATSLPAFANQTLDTVLGEPRDATMKERPRRRTVEEGMSAVVRSDDRRAGRSQTVDDGTSGPRARAPKSVFEPGELVEGKVRVLRPAGETGHVYTGRDVTSGKSVWIQVVEPVADLTPDELRSTVLDRLTSLGRDERLPQVKHVSVTMMTPWLALAARGEASLASSLRTPSALARVVAACRAVHALHERGVLHLALSPEAFDVNGDGRVALRHLGRARAGTMDAPPTAPARGEGTVRGPAAYLAPEQVQGAVCDSRTDVYALGVLAYEALAGAPPFGGNSFMATCLAHMQDPVPPLRHSEPGASGVGVSRTLEAAVLRALDKRRGARFPSAGDMADALEHASLGQS